MIRAYLLHVITCLITITLMLGLSAGAIAQDNNPPDNSADGSAAGNGDDADGAQDTARDGAADAGDGAEAAPEEPREEVEGSSPVPFQLPPIEKPDPALVRQVNALIDRLPTKKTRKHARDQIIRIGKRSTPVMLNRMKDRDFTVRWEMVNIQGSIQDKRAIPAMAERIVGDPNPHVRWRGMWAMTQFRDDQSKKLFAHLFRQSMQGQNQATRWHAAVAMTMLGKTESLNVIYEGIDQADEWLQWEAINALGRVRDGRTIQILARCLTPQKFSLRNRQEAALSLGKSKDSAAVKPLAERGLTDPQTGVRWRAALALGKIGDPAAKPLIQARLRVEKDPEVRKRLVEALEDIEKFRGRARPRPRTRN